MSLDSVKECYFFMHNRTIIHGCAIMYIKEKRTIKTADLLYVYYWFDNA